MAPQFTKSLALGHEDDATNSKPFWKSLAMSLILCLGTVFLFVALPVGLVVSDAVVYVLWTVTALGVVATTLVLCKTRFSKESQLCNDCELGSPPLRDALAPPYVVPSEASAPSPTLPAAEIHRERSGTYFENLAFESAEKAEPPPTDHVSSETPVESVEQSSERKRSTRRRKGPKAVRNELESTLKRFFKRK